MNLANFWAACGRCNIIHSGHRAYYIICKMKLFHVLLGIWTGNFLLIQAHKSNRWRHATILEFFL